MSLPAEFEQIELFSTPDPEPKRIEFRNPALNHGLFSSATDEWETPQWLFDRLDEEFGFELDVCALPHNAKCRRYFTPEQDGLKQKWRGVCWCNPPYGREIGKWIAKAYQSAQAGSTVVALIPARTDAGWWHDYCMKAAEIRFIRGRVKFGGAEWNAPFPSAVVVFRPGVHDELRVTSM